MFTHLSGWKSRVEIDQRAREGRLRQEWREAPPENDRVSIPVIFWSVLRLVAQSVERIMKQRNPATTLYDRICDIVRQPSPCTHQTLHQHCRVAPIEPIPSATCRPSCSSTSAITTLAPSRE